MTAEKELFTNHSGSGMKLDYGVEVKDGETIVIMYEPTDKMISKILKVWKLVEVQPE